MTIGAHLATEDVLEQLGEPLAAASSDQRLAFDPVRFIRRHGVLFLLTLTYATSLMDRQVLSILQEPIKKDLHLSDGQLGLLTGFSFALFYSVLGIPIGLLSDRWKRRNVLAISMLGWSLLTVATGAAASFVYMLAARVGVAVGEAGVTPAGTSLIAERYPAGRRAAALAVFTGVGGPLGTLVGFIWGGYLQPALGWRITFVLAGLPGIAFSLLLLWIVREARRPASAFPTVPFMEGVRHLAGHKTLRRLAFGLAFGMISTFAGWNWMASYLVRYQGMPVGQVGLWLGVIFGVGGAVGNFGGALLADRVGAKDVRWYLWIPAIISILSAPLMCAALMARTGESALFFLILPCTFGAAFGAITMSVLQMLTPERFRSTAAALYVFLTMLFGYGLGTWLIGFVSDLLAPAAGPASLKYALLLITPAAAVLAAIQFFRAASALAIEAPGGDLT